MLRARLALLALLVPLLATGCTPVIQRYSGLPKGADIPADIRKFKYEKHAVESTITYVTTTSSGGGSSTSFFRSYYVANISYPRGALVPYFDDSGCPKAAALMSKGEWVEGIWGTVIYGASAYLMYSGLANLNTSSDTFQVDYARLGGAALLLGVGPWVLDTLTWGYYFKPGIETFNQYLKKDLKVEVGVTPDGQVRTSAEMSF